MTQEQAAVEAAGYRLNLSFVQMLRREVEYEYTSKARLQSIALSALATLEAGYTRAAEQAEAAMAAESGLLVTPQEGLVVPGV